MEAACHCHSRVAVTFVRKQIVFETIEHIPAFDSALEVEPRDNCRFRLRGSEMDD